MPSTVTFSTTLFEEAKRCLRQVQADAKSGSYLVRGDLSFSHAALTAILLAATAAEAGINEAIAFLQDPHGGSHRLPPDFDDLPIFQKWYLLPIIVTGQRFDRGVFPWQDFELLFRLRNEMVHYKLSMTRIPKVVTALHAKRLTFDITDGPWLHSVATNKMAIWAINTVAAMFSKLAELLAKAQPEILWPLGSRTFRPVAST